MGDLPVAVLGILRRAECEQGANAAIVERRDLAGQRRGRAELLDRVQQRSDRLGAIAIRGGGVEARAPVGAEAARIGAARGLRIGLRAVENAPLHRLVLLGKLGEAPPSCVGRRNRGAVDPPSVGVAIEVTAGRDRGVHVRARQRGNGSRARLGAGMSRHDVRRRGVGGTRAREREPNRDETGHSVCRHGGATSGEWFRAAARRGL